MGPWHTLRSTIEKGLGRIYQRYAELSRANSASNAVDLRGVRAQRVELEFAQQFITLVDIDAQAALETARRQLSACEVPTLIRVRTSYTAAWFRLPRSSREAMCAKLSKEASRQFDNSEYSNVDISTDSTCSFTAHLEVRVGSFLDKTTENAVEAATDSAEQ